MNRSESRRIGGKICSEAVGAQLGWALLPGPERHREDAVHTFTQTPANPEGPSREMKNEETGLIRRKSTR